MSEMLSVIGLNCLTAVLIGWLAYRLWRWRCELAQVTAWLNTGLAPQQMGYAIALKRAQLAETRLELTRLQLRSKQIRQIAQFIKFLRLLLLYRAARR